jgi:hypothetical protein
MSHRWVLISLAAGAAIAIPAQALAQASAQQADTFRLAQATPKQKQSRDPQLDVEELTPAQIKRAQELDQPPPAARQRDTTTAPAPKSAAVAKPPAAPSQPAQTIACSGAFAKESSHIKLITFFRPGNVEYTEVDASEGKKIMASVLFPKDPKRRLEVWWANEATRSETHLIVINGQSTWTAPKGLRLGLQFAALEKLNGKPFKAKGFDKDGLGMVSDWQGGAFEQLPGGCRSGVYLRLDPKAPAEAREALSGDKEFLSNDASVRTAKPAISEIVLGY